MMDFAKKKVFMQRISLFLFLVLFAIASAGCFGGSTSGEFDERTFYVRVEPGMSAEDVKRILTEKKIITSPFKYWLYSKLKGADGKMQVGTYAFRRGMDEDEVLTILVSGRTASIRFTVPEGYTVNDIATRLEEQGIVKAKEFKREAKNFVPFSFIVKSELATYPCEGFLFPDTYETKPDATPKEILQQMADNFDAQLTDEMRTKAASMGISVYDLATLASMVEKEVRYDDERPIVAQVFFKRLDISMPLQSCASIQYLLDEPREELSIADTQIDSPYNTYQHFGLPPGPVSNPGIKAIKAVLEPAKTDYLYFVADKEGRTHFTTSYGEHLSKVDEVR